jgi:hypothetical protein
MQAQHGAFAAFELLSAEPQAFLKPVSVIEWLLHFPLELLLQIYFALIISRRFRTSSDYTTPNVIIGKDFDGSIRVIIEVLSRDLSGRAGKTTKIIIQDSRCPDRNSNRAFPDYKSRTSPLCQPARFSIFILWYDGWKPVQWNEQRWPLLGNGVVKTSSQQRIITQ